MKMIKIDEKQDSIKISKTSKGYNWEIKRYYDYDKIKFEEVINQIEKIDEKLSERFK